MGRTKSNAMSRHARPEHKKAARMLGYALTLGPEFEVWSGCATFFRARLSARERAIAAWSFMKSLDDTDRALVAGIAVKGRTGPFPTFDPGDADLWAASATRDELVGYAIAALTRMDAAGRDAVLHRMRRAA